MKIAVFNAHMTEPDCTHWQGLADGMNQLGIDLLELDCRMQTLFTMLTSLHEFEPDLIIYALSDPIHSNWYKQIREEFNCPIVFWYCDIRDERTGGYMDIPLKGYVDAIFLSNDGQKEFYKKNTGVEDVFYLPQAVIPVKEIEYDPEYAFEGVFIGSMHTTDFWGNRYQFIAAIQKKFPGFKHLNGQSNDERMKYYRLMPKIYGSSKICLDVSHVWDVRKYASNRYYVIPGMGGFSLTKRFPGCEEQYPDKVGKVYFDTVDEFLNLADYYMNHEDERNEIKRKGLEHCKAFHTYPIRIKHMLSCLSLS